MPRTYVNPQNRELSWLSFNERVLQEAADKTVNPVSRLHFLGIVSSNLDEFYRVRVGSLNFALKSLQSRQIKEEKEIHALLDAVRIRTLHIQDQINEILQDILLTLEKHKVYILDHTKFNAVQSAWAKDYFDHKIRHGLSIVTNCTRKNLSRIIRTDWLYLAAHLMRGKTKTSKPQIAIIEIPTDTLPRFIEIPHELASRDSHNYMWLDDIIRIGLPDVFSVFGYKSVSAYTIKLTRNAEMTVDNDIFANYIEHLSRKLRQRVRSNFVRLTYDATMPEDVFTTLLSRLSMEKGATIIAGGRYHSLRDFANFPAPIGIKGLKFPILKLVGHKAFHPSKSYIKAIEKQDALLHYPYQSFDHIIKLMREASLDPSVEKIQISIYRVAKNSEVMDSLISALHNRKEVTVFMELKARFDEEANIAWVRRLQEAGAIVLTGFTSYKVHSKLIHIVRKNRPDIAVVSTGNFNEKSARLYSDLSLITADEGITNDISQLFGFLKDNTQQIKPKHLLMSPRYMRKKIARMINNEIVAAKNGQEAYIKIKMNNIVDKSIVRLLDKAARRGVRLEIVVRSTCALDPEIPEYENRVRIVSIVDRFLEHARLLVFANKGDPLIYISSADLMKRNLDHRIEAAAPVYSPSIRKLLLKLFDLQLNDNCKARIVNSLQNNPYQKSRGKRIHAQKETWKYLKSLNE